MKFVQIRIVRIGLEGWASCPKRAHATQQMKSPGMKGLLTSLWYKCTLQFVTRIFPLITSSFPHLLLILEVCHRQLPPAVLNIQTPTCSNQCSHCLEPGSLLTVWAGEFAWLVLGTSKVIIVVLLSACGWSALHKEKRHFLVHQQHV